MSTSPRTSAASPEDAASEAWALAFRTMAPDAPPLRFEIVRANGRASAAPSWRAARDAAMLLAATGGAAAAGVSPVTARALCGEDVLREQRFG
jgi:hypothetical protein